MRAGYRQGPVNAPEADIHTVLDHRFELPDEAVMRDRLGDIAVGAELAGALLVEFIGLRGADDQLGARQLRDGAEAGAELETVELGHHDVEDDAGRPTG